METENSKKNGRAFIFLNGEFVPPTVDWPKAPSPDDFVVAADGGAKFVRALAWPLNYLVGDFDSLPPKELEFYQSQNTTIERHPVEKDEIDFELALMAARKRGFHHFEVLGALGGRWDMTLGNIFLPQADLFKNELILFRHGAWTLQLLTGPGQRVVRGSLGDGLSLLPLGADALGVTLENCKYPLMKGCLKLGLSRGLSNELSASEAKISLESGALIITHQAR